MNESFIVEGVKFTDFKLAQKYANTFLPNIVAIEKAVKTIFSFLGFSSTGVFVEKDNRLHFIGDLFLDPKVEMNYYGIYERYLTPDEIPTLEQIKEEYDKQYKEQGIVCGNKKIVYAG